jgi:uncharacterized protein YdeI (BOF family)
MKKLIAVAMFSLVASSAFAECKLSITRTACPGKETEAFKPYDGKTTTEETIKKATTQDACVKEGEKASKIVRKGTLSKKAVKISFEGKDAGEKSDEKACN